MATQAALACQAWALALLVATGRARYWQIALLALVTGLANTLDTPARQSFVMGLVGRQDLVNAVALNSASFNAARIVGPAVAGLVIARFGVAAGLRGQRPRVRRGAGHAARPARRGRHASVARHLRSAATSGEGIRFVLRTPRVRAALGALFVVSLCVFNFTVYVPLLVRTVLGLGPEGFGFLMAALGVGAVAGALAIGARANPEPGVGLLIGAGVVACAGLVGLSAVRHFWTAAPVLVVTGFAGIVTVTGSNTALQLGAPDELRGRVMSLYTWVFGGVFPIGLLPRRRDLGAPRRLGRPAPHRHARARPARAPGVDPTMAVPAEPAEGLPEVAAPNDQQAGRRRTAGSIRRGTSCPSPAAPSTRPRSAITRPRSSVVTGQPDTAQPSQGL